MTNPGKVRVAMDRKVSVSLKQDSKIVAACVWECLVCFGLVGPNLLPYLPGRKLSKWVRMAVRFDTLILIMVYSCY
jgi:hypothetical protein